MAGRVTGMGNRKTLMQGNEACVEGALAAGMRFFAGYPITPSTEIAERCSVRLPQVGGCFIQMEDELASLAAVLGASAAGVKAMTATSGPGFSLQQENIGFGCTAEIPCVIVDVQRCGPSTGRPTAPSQGDYQQARWGTHGDHPAIAVSPFSVEEMYTLTVRAFNLSEKYRTPVILLTDEIVAHMREGVEIPDASALEIVDRRLPQFEEGKRQAGTLRDVPAFIPFGSDRRPNYTGLLHDESGFPSDSPQTAQRLVRRLLRKIEENLDDIIQVDTQMMDDADVAVISYGGCARAAMAAVLEARERGVRAGLWRPVTVWPFPGAALSEAIAHVNRIVVAELSDGQMCREVERINAGRKPLHFVGRIDGSVIPHREILFEIMRTD